MNLKSLPFSLLALATTAALNAQAGTLKCVDQYSTSGVTALLTADVASENVLNNIKLTYDGETYASANNVELDPSYRPTKYKGLNRFQFVQTQGEPTTFSLLLPPLASQNPGVSFQAKLMQQGTDGGGVESLVCTVN